MLPFSPPFGTVGVLDGMARLVPQEPEALRPGAPFHFEHPGPLETDEARVGKVERHPDTRDSRRAEPLI